MPRSRARRAGAHPADVGRRCLERLEGATAGQYTTGVVTGFQSCPPQSDVKQRRAGKIPGRRSRTLCPPEADLRDSAIEWTVCTVCACTISRRKKPRYACLERVPQPSRRRWQRTEGGYWSGLYTPLGKCTHWRNHNFALRKPVCPLFCYYRARRQTSLVSNGSSDNSFLRVATFF